MEKVFVCGIALLLCSLFVSPANSAEGQQSQAKLLVSKFFLNQYIVEGHDLSVQYVLYNVGGSPATNVILTDETFPGNDFEKVVGILKAKWDKIPPGGNVTHSVVMRPLNSGYFNFTAAQVTYVPHDGASPQIGFTSGLGEMAIMSHREYDRRFSSHVFDWLLFGLMSAPCTAIPFLLYYSSKKKYEPPAPKSKKH